VCQARKAWWPEDVSLGEWRIFHDGAPVNLSCTILLRGFSFGVTGIDIKDATGMNPDNIRLIRHFILSVVFLVAGFSNAFADPALKKVTLLLDWYPEAENAGYFYALTHGLYARVGLDVQISPIGPNASVEPQVALGKYDFGLGSSDQVLIARSRGIPLVAVMGSLQHDPVGVMVHASSPVHTFADLEGQTIAAQPGVPWLSYVVKKYHLQNLKTTPLNFDYASFLHNPNYIQQCFITSEPPIMEHAGVKVRSLWVKDTGCDAYMALESSEQFVAAHPDTVRAFVAASIAGWRGYLNDPTAADAEILRRNPAMTAIQLNLSRKALVDYHLIDGPGNEVGHLDPNRLKNQYMILRDLNIIAADYDYRKSFTTEFIPQP
jgi:NitT/TauT family transport system substrate-binding protein